MKTNGNESTVHSVPSVANLKCGKCLLYDAILKQKVIAHEESPQNAGVVLRVDICEVNSLH